MRLDLDGIAERTVALPVELRRYERVIGLRGKALLLYQPVEDALGASPFDVDAPDKGVLEAFDFDTRETEQLPTGVSDVAVDPEARVMLCRAGNRLRALPAGEKPSEEKGEGPGRQSGWIDLDRVKVSVRPGAEWRQMFREAWRLQRDHFWAEGIGGVAWDEVYARYLPLVDRAATRSELSDLLWELHGELGTSHAYEIGGDHPDRPRYRQGHLGVDWRYDRDEGAFYVTGIARGDPWDAEATSPLSRPGVDVRAGDHVLAIAGEPVGWHEVGCACPARRWSPRSAGAAGSRGPAAAAADPERRRSRRRLGDAASRGRWARWTVGRRSRTARRGSRWRR